jgi:glycosyltransferase involved in cell wall biosynthesis
MLAAPMFPDAVAAVTLKQQLELPLAALAIGSDVMVYAQQTPALQAQLADMLKEVDLPVGVSQALCRHLPTIGPCQRDPLCVYLGRDNTRFVPAQDKRIPRRQLGWGAHEVVAVYVGRLAPHKGIQEMVEALGPLLRQHPKLRLVCVGDGPARADLESLARDVGRPDAVSLEGEQSPEHVPLYLQGADMLVFPSHSEGMPQAVLEAMNCGLAVVATNVGGIPEAVIPEETGLLVEPHNVPQLRDAVERLTEDRTFRHRIARQGKQHVDTVFDAKTNADKLAQALRSLVPS